MNRLLPILLLAGLPLGTLATEPQAAPPVPGHPGTPPRAFAVRPPSREQVAMRMMVRQLLLDRYDTNHNLHLDSEERRRLMADADSARRQSALDFIRRFDADADGKLSPEERAAMQQAMEDRRHADRKAGQESAGTAETPPPAPPHHRVGKRGPRAGHRPPHMGKEGRLVAFTIQRLTMDAYDADKNGILDTEESARLREDGAQLYRAREAELLSLYDADGNGWLSEAELQAALAERLPRRQLPPHAAGAIPPAPPHAEAAEPPTPPRPHGQGPARRGGLIHRLLDTHFDIDILLHLATPQAEGDETLPCKPSTPSAN